ncbi:MAG: hypothetical protein KBT12_05990 [Bacteroidales bacterium]|nr:hypothetical protein [Candidatus Physcousia equi]
MKRALYILISLLCLTSCDEADCTIDNTVELKLGFYDANGKPMAYADTLNVTASGTDSLLFNRGVGTQSLGLPLSFHKEADTLVLTYNNQEQRVSDHIIVKKKNYEHFESIECPVKMFHTITEVTCTHHFIDSVVLVFPTVAFYNGENIKVYLHSGD